MSKVYHVSKSGNDQQSGAEDSPFLTINHAAQVALPGDSVVVHEGEYRELVDPQYGGLSNKRRITYQAAEGEKVVIKGSEEVKGWTEIKDGVWSVEIENAFFGRFNPYVEKVTGDWLIYKHDVRHLGDVYLNGKSFYEVESYDELFDPEERTEVYDHWTKEMSPIADPEQTTYVWFCEVGETTKIYGNFQGADPNEELVEINVRRSVFYPSRTGCNYITVRGFEMAHAASPWTPPTADQPGLIGPNWSKGWIIEDNIIHDAKCSAVSLGKEYSTGHNHRTLRGDKPGFIYQQESVFAALNHGWSRENIGSHVVRRNVIYDCGQNGIVGHLGSAFCEIYDNHIYNIALRREFYGHEIAGIKLHAAIDTRITHNRIHDCSLGIWLDWQAQGTQVNRNLLYRNNRDIFIEVTHGPHLVNHNVFASRHSLVNHAQGGAYVNNLFAGGFELKKILDRMTPYHLPHSTVVRGYTAIYGGDERFYQNIFFSAHETEQAGTAFYEGYPESLEDFMAEVESRAPGDHNIFAEVSQPLYTSANYYLKGAEAASSDKTSYVAQDFDPAFSVVEEGDEVYLEITLPEASVETQVYETATLPRVRIVDQEYEYPNGEDVRLDEDYFGEVSDESFVGPIRGLKVGENRVKVW